MIEELLGEGSFESHGSFTVADPEKLRQLSHNLLPDPKLYPLKALQALVAGGAEAVNVRPGWGNLTFEVQRGLRPLQICSNWLRHIFEGLGTDVERHLCSSVLAGWDEFAEAEVSWCGQRWLWRPADGLSVQVQPPSPGPSFIRFRPRRRSLGRPPQWTRFHACPIPIYEGSDTWQGLAYADLAPDPSKWWEEGVCVAVACAQEGGPLSLMQMPTEPLFFEPDGGGPRSPLIRARRVYCLSNRSDHCLLLPVAAGLALNPRPIDLGLPGLRCLVSVEREGLNTDLSQFQVRDDEALTALCLSLREEAERLLADVSQRLPSWQPPLTFTNGSLSGGLVGLVGGVVAGTCASLTLGASGFLCLMGLPAAALGAALMKQRWRRLTIARLARLERGRD